MSFAVGPVAFSGTSRSTSATIQPNILHYIASVAEERGVDLRPVLEQVGLDETVMRSAALRVSYRQGSTVIRRALELTGDARLGMRVGAVQHPTAWGLLGFALMASDTLQHAFETGVRYQNLSGAMVMWSAEQGDEGFVLRADLPDPGLEPGVAVFLIEEGLTSVVALSRLTAGPAFTPALAEFAFPEPAEREPYGAFFGCPVRFGAPVSRLVIDPVWARPGCRPGSGDLCLGTGDARHAAGLAPPPAGAAGSAGDLRRAEPSGGSLVRRAGTQAVGQRADAPPPTGRLRYHVRCAR